MIIYEAFDYIFSDLFFISFQMNFTESFIKARRLLYFNAIKMSTSFWRSDFNFSFFISGIWFPFCLLPRFPYLHHFTLCLVPSLAFYLIPPPFSCPLPLNAFLCCPVLLFLPFQDFHFCFRSSPPFPSA